MCTLAVGRHKSTFRKAFGSEIMENGSNDRYDPICNLIQRHTVPTCAHNSRKIRLGCFPLTASTGVWAPVGNALSVLHWGSYCLTGDGIPSCLCMEGQCEGHKGYCVLIVMRRRKVLASMVKNSKQLSKHIKTIVTCSMIMMWWLRDMQ